MCTYINQLNIQGDEKAKKERKEEEKKQEDIK
jgi:hypothetical protein